MGFITVRNVDDAVKESIRVTAARNGRSIEAEIRALLERTYAPTDADRAARIRAMSGEAWVDHLIAIADGVELPQPERSGKATEQREIFGAD
ncbi:plasmid stability protein [Sphingomonas sp. UYAg733]|uniref:FitA-like ribbon-helix-helix domain-containing protein n=1 Tax=Sphingomonas sp. So64.6b TaxID=2997354 RepID=UPI0016031A6A|nr:plasmid stabilization protein [Sphingomonas sp. So64.6b]QNA84239.1 plasmid stabilization protein [Sphingomonas sp. So64.6b]